MKKIILIVLLVFTTNKAQFTEMGEARGLFMGVSVGPQIPIGDFAKDQSLGIGFDFDFSYSDNILAPLFLFTKLGYRHFPGDKDFYRISDYSSFSSDVFTISSGIKYYFPPLFENVVILMPVVEGGISLAYFEKSHVFKLSSGKGNFLEDNFKIGGYFGAGISMFLLDVMAHYNYLHDNQYLSFDLTIRIPIYIKM